MSSTLQDSGYGVKVGRVTTRRQNASLALNKYKKDEKYFGALLSVNGKRV